MLDGIHFFGLNLPATLAHQIPLKKRMFNTQHDARIVTSKTNSQRYFDDSLALVISFRWRSNKV